MIINFLFHQGYSMYDETDGVCSPNEGVEDDSNERICKTCNREYHSKYQYNKHMAEHRTCGIDGCAFNAHKSIIEKHIEMQHCTGLYDRIKNVVTPEDIAKWVAERKRRYPSKENIQKRYLKQEEMLKRGERLKKSNDKFDKSNKLRCKCPYLNSPNLRV